MLEIRENIALAPLTTIKLGGNARFFVRCHSVAELREALKWAKEKNIRWHVLSGGSNTIFLDQGFDGLVIKIELEGVEFGKDGKIKVAAGEEWDPLVEECVRCNLAGIECLSGIPGLVGATPIQNVGAYGQEVSQVITKVKALKTDSLEEIEFQNSDCKFSYRWSRFKGRDAGKYIITEVEFQLALNGKPNVSYRQVQEQLKTIYPTLQNIREIVLDLRKKKSMVLELADLNTRSCGSFFENILLQDVPDASGMPTFTEARITRVPSAWLIEQAGFPKGFKKGGVGISANHNLALVNYGGTTQELLGLAEEIQTTVKKRFGIQLKREPIVVK